MNTRKYEKHYMASLYGKVYEEPLDRVFPIYRGVENFDAWSQKPRDTSHYKTLDHKTLQRVFVASDQHLGHKNIIKYADRPFESVTEMNDIMVGRHNLAVGPDDIVILGGDIAFCPDDIANQWLSVMNGYKILILGNHDWDKKRRAVRNLDVDEMHMSYYLDVGDKEVLITHAPFQSTVMMTNQNLINVYGHIHEKKIDHPRYINMCVEHIDYTPTLLTELITES